ncbi:MAG: hypothetical protein RMJ67_04450 [Elusimicrobiota bacterium]|nr:hypothetical protein [Endomicrobiia bacterium]MDW8165744.1 hypothetical protein [Elusimicrobiota bacterium]
MKYFDFINKMINFFITLIILVTTFGIYDIFLISKWLQKRFLEKFSVVLVLKDGSDPTNIIENVKKNINLLKIKNISFLDKNQIYEKIIENKEMKTLLSVIKNNPFSDVIKIEFMNYHDKEIKKILTLDKIFPEIREIIFDYNIKSYLSRLYSIKNLFDKIFILLFIVGILIIFLRVMLFWNIKISLIFIVLFSGVYFLFMVLNIKFMNNFTSYEIIKLDSFNLIIHILIYIFCLLQAINTDILQQQK